MAVVVVVGPDDPVQRLAAQRTVRCNRLLSRLLLMERAQCEPTNLRSVGMAFLHNDPATAVALAGCRGDALGKAYQLDAALRADRNKRALPALHPPQQDDHEGDVDKECRQCDREFQTALEMGIGPAQEDQLEDSQRNTDTGKGTTVST